MAAFPQPQSLQLRSSEEGASHEVVKYLLLEQLSSNTVCPPSFMPHGICYGLGFDNRYR